MGIKHRFKWYRPVWWLLLVDLLLWLAAVGTIVVWRMLAHKSEIVNYVYFFILLFFVWTTIGYFLDKYRSLRLMDYIKAAGKVFGLSFILIGLVLILFFINPLSQSEWVSVMLIEFVAIYNIFFLLLYYGYRYALNMDDAQMVFENRPPSPLVVSKERLSDEDVKVIEESITNYSDASYLTLVRERIDLGSSTTKVLASDTHFNFESIKPLKHDQIVNLKPLNHVREINKLFCTVNQRIADDGLFLCCFMDQKVTKERILQRYPLGLNWVIYCGHFFVRRICPKLFLTNHLYFDLTKGKNRSISQTEVLGRLYYCGFEVLYEDRVGDMTFVTACRHYDPQPQVNRKYGPFIKLNRVGKGGRRFNVYKMRTMHPYSEYLQAYMYDKNDLQEGGKIKDDIRISTLGAFMRKYWIDEVPMIVNLVRGDMKLVGVRPLSHHFFSLYAIELQEKRTLYKPGLLPPFYADMPKTLDEIQESELRYLEACEQYGVVRTDFNYFWKIVNNIVVRKARSH